MHMQDMDWYYKVDDYIEIKSLRVNKTGILPSYNYVSTTLRLHRLHQNEKANWEQYKDNACCSEQILKAAP